MRNKISEATASYGASEHHGFADRAETLAILGNIGVSTLYAGMGENPPTYPRAYRLGRMKVGWKRSELHEWCQARQQVAYAEPKGKS
jgi:predicted DNA-binding transcriptional regulator AlpA